MAGPVEGIKAAQIAQQGLQEPAAAKAKQGPSKFDKALSANAPDAAAKAQKPVPVNQVERPGKVQTVDLKKLRATVSSRGLDPVTKKAEVSHSTRAMMGMLADMEKGQGLMDRLISQGVSGKNFSSSELLALQAGMYKYTQELELTGKVVEKATSGLKDTLKTQV